MTDWEEKNKRLKELLDELKENPYKYCLPLQPVKKKVCPHCGLPLESDHGTNKIG